MGDEGYPKMAWQARTQGKSPNRRPRQTWEEGIKKILKQRGIEWNVVRAIDRDRENDKRFVNPLNLLAEEVQLSEVK